VLQTTNAVLRNVGGESRSGKKIPRRKACRFDSGPGHQFRRPSLFLQRRPFLFDDTNCMRRTNRPILSASLVSVIRSFVNIRLSVACVVTKQLGGLIYLLNKLLAFAGGIFCRPALELSPKRWTN